MHFTLWTLASKNICGNLPTRKQILKSLFQCSSNANDCIPCTVDGCSTRCQNDNHLSVSILTHEEQRYSRLMDVFLAFTLLQVLPLKKKGKRLKLFRDAICNLTFKRHKIHSIICLGQHLSVAQITSRRCCLRISANSFVKTLEKNAWSWTSTSMLFGCSHGRRCINIRVNFL